jgi:hypothetical protein
MKLKSLIFFLMMLILIQCEKMPKSPVDVYNPMDPNDPNYQLPQVTITDGPMEGDTINTDVVRFSWKGNLEDMLFMYRIDGHPWSNPTPDTTVTLELLDEGVRTFQVKGKYLTGELGNIVERSFVVDALKGTSVVLFPRLMTIYSETTFKIKWKILDADSFVSFSGKLKFDPGRLQVTNIQLSNLEEGNILTRNGGTIVEFHNIDNAKGELSLDCTVLNGSPANVSGSGTIAEITFKHLQGYEASISITDVKMRNLDNHNLIVKNVVNSLVRLK